MRIYKVSRESVFVSSSLTDWLTAIGLVNHVEKIEFDNCIVWYEGAEVPKDFPHEYSYSPTIPGTQHNATRVQAYLDRYCPGTGD